MGNTSEARALQVVDDGSLGAVSRVESYAMTSEAINEQVKLIQKVTDAVMIENTHYGTIPGCGDKKNLLKPGAEKLQLTFRFAPKYQITKTDLARGHREYEIVCSLIHIPTDQFIGQGVGSCSTMESKYRYRKAEQKCPECGKEAIIRGKQEYGGGWVCWKKKGGCDAKFKDGDKRIENQSMGRVEYEDPADYYNTVLKIAKKRAQVDAILTATAASDIFAQDLDDMPETDDMKQERQNGNNGSGQGSKTMTKADHIKVLQDNIAKAGFTEKDMLSVSDGVDKLEDFTVKNLIAMNAKWAKTAGIILTKLKQAKAASNDVVDTITCAQTDDAIPLSDCDKCNLREGCPSHG